LHRVIFLKPNPSLTFFISLDAVGAQVPEWVFQGKADHDWKSYDDVYNQDWCAFFAGG
jgi:hypothetical protein